MRDIPVVFCKKYSHGLQYFIVIQQTVDYIKLCWLCKSGFWYDIPGNNMVLRPGTHPLPPLINTAFLEFFIQL